MKSNTPIYGLIFALLFHQLKSSFFTVPGCCFSLINLSEDELDAVFHDPTRRIPNGYSPISRSSLRRHENLEDSKSTSRPLKSILKKPSKESISQLTLKSKSVSFSIDNEEKLYEMEDEKSPEPSDLLPPAPQINRSLNYHVNSDKSQPIIGHIPYNYQTDSAVTVNEHIEIMELPVDTVESIRINYPGLGNVKINVLDLAGLVLFANYHRYPVEFFQTSILLVFFSEFLDIFPFSLPMVQSLHVNVGNYKMTKMKALDGLFKFAFKNLLYYTIEAFYLTYGQDRAENFIRESVRVGDLKLFTRFLNVFPEIKPEKLLIWSLKFGNERVYQDSLGVVGSLEKVKKNFRHSIICSVTKIGYYFPGIVDHLFAIESEHFDDALELAFKHGNHKMFKDMIKYDNSLFEKSHDPKILNVLRHIFENKPEKLVIEEFESEDSLKEVFTKLLMLDSDDPEVLEIFKIAVQDLNCCDYSDDLLKLALFLKTRDYYKILLTGCDQLKLFTRIDDVNVGIWDLMKGSKFHNEVVGTLISTPHFSIIHAIGNSEFPKTYWSSLMERFNDFRYTPQMNFIELRQKYGFNEDILNQSDLVTLGIHSKRVWSLLELAVLNFNHKAVEEILKRSSSTDGIVIKFAKDLKELLESKDYGETHEMKSVAVKQRVLEDYRRMKPDFYFEPGPKTDFVIGLKHSINIIITMLSS